MDGSDPPPRTLVYFSDYSCPLSYLGKQIVDWYAEWAAFPIDLEYRFIDLHWYMRTPDGDLDKSIAHDQDSHYQELVETSKIVMDEFDLHYPMVFPPEVDSWNAHLAGFYVYRKYPTPVFESFHDAVFDSLWLDGEEISELDVLSQIADSVGIAPSEIDDALNDEDLESDLKVSLKNVANSRRPISPMVVYQKIASYGVTPFEELRHLWRFGAGHPADEKGARWFRYHDYFMDDAH